MLSSQISSGRRSENSTPVRVTPSIAGRAYPRGHIRITFFKMLIELL